MKHSANYLITPVHFTACRFSIAAFLLFALLLTGCSHDLSGREDSGTVQLKVSGTCAGLTTKAADPVLPTGQTAGIYVTGKDAALSSSYFSNVEYTSGNAGVMATDQHVDLTIGSNYDVYAYGPYQNNISDVTAIPFSHGTDVLWAPKNTLSGVSATSNTVVLGFTHRTAQIVFNVVFAGDFSSGSKVFTSSSAVQISSFYSQGQLNATTGELAPSVTTTDTSLKGVGTGSAGSMTLGIPATCFIPAKGGNMTLTVKVTHEGKDYLATISDTFTAGIAYNYTVTLSGYSPTLGISGKVTDWTQVLDTVPLY
jgi:hypothetical protein